METTDSYDLILVGGGLQNGLIALAVLSARPETKLVMVERGASLGGNHTWCFHAGDVPADLVDVLEPLCVFRWPGYEVRFPNLTRILDEPYAGTTSERLASVVNAAFDAAPDARLITGRSAEVVEPHQVRLEGGEVLAGTLVIDARGPEAYVDPAGSGFQKFVGVELRLAEPHGMDRPVLIDATVPQVGGFRFFYALPLAPDVVLVEDTTFARDRELDLDKLEAGCLAYARAAGFVVDSVLRRESGALPMPWQGQHDPPSAPLRAGYQGGWFHPATGYSFPVAARLAAFIAARAPEDVCGADLDALFAAQMRQVRFCHRLNRMLFAWFAVGDEWNVFERFYRLPIPLIRRFYALEMTTMDRTRLVVGRPPRGFSLRARLARRA